MAKSAGCAPWRNSIRLIPIQCDVTLLPTVPVNGNLVDRTEVGVECHPARDSCRTAAANIIVEGDCRQRPICAAGVNRQQGIKVTPQRVDRHRAGGRRAPLKPKGVPTHIAGVIGFSRFFGRQQIVRC